MLVVQPLHKNRCLSKLHPSVYGVSWDHLLTGPTRVRSFANAFQVIP